MSKTIKILCTLGPSSFKARTIKKLDALGADIFRINLSHTDASMVGKTILKIRKATSKPICIDTEGAQIRNGIMVNEKVIFNEGGIIKISRDEIVGDSALRNKSLVIYRSLQIRDGH